MEVIFLEQAIIKLQETILIRSGLWGYLGLTIQTRDKPRNLPRDKLLSLIKITYRLIMVSTYQQNLDTLMPLQNFAQQKAKNLTFNQDNAIK